jgi:DNA transformation protein
MTRKEEFAEYVVELLSSSGPVNAKRMFGGHGIYRDGRMFALIANDILYLKCDDQTRPRFEAAGSEPFMYEAKGRTRMATSYWRMPDEAMESPALAGPWAKLGYEAALRKASTAPKARKRTATSSAKKTAKKPGRAAKRVAKRRTN